MKRVKLQRNKKTSKAGNLILRRGKARCNQNCPLESTLPLRHASVLTVCLQFSNVHANYFKVYYYSADIFDSPVRVRVMGPALFYWNQIEPK